jgi:transposase, IS30 family
MGIKYSQLDERKRIIIEYLLEQGLRPARIAYHLGVDRSTLGRELRRGWHMVVGRYTSAHGQFVHDQGRRSAGRARRKLGLDLSSPAWQPICRALRAGWSPEQYCGRMRLIDSLLSFSPPRPSICHETIYKAIFNLPKSQARRALTQLLRQSPGGRRRRRRRDRSSRFTGIQNITPIEQRPAEIESRLQPGHWEGDLIKGANGKSCIATLVERSSRLVLLLPLRSAGADELCHALIGRLRQIEPALRLSLTYDRGTEMARHLTVSEQLNMPVYFCGAYRPWQRGTNENTNGLLRQYLPKGLDLSCISEQQLAHIERALNGRPRRILGYKTPQEVFEALLRRPLDAMLRAA